jgi:hypothetical protein
MTTKLFDDESAAKEYCDLVSEHRTTPLTIDDIAEAFIAGAGFQRLQSLLLNIEESKLELGIEKDSKDKKFTDFGDA